MISGSDKQKHRCGIRDENSFLYQEVLDSATGCHDDNVALSDSDFGEKKPPKSKRWRERVFLLLKQVVQSPYCPYSDCTTSTFQFVVDLENIQSCNATGRILQEQDDII